LTENVKTVALIELSITIIYINCITSNMALKLTNLCIKMTYSFIHDLVYSIMETTQLFSESLNYSHLLKPLIFTMTAEI